MLYEEIEVEMQAGSWKFQAGSATSYKSPYKGNSLLAEVK